VQFDEFLALIWKRRLTVAAVFLGCMLAAAAFAFTASKRYESTATVAFTPDPKNGQNTIPSDNLAALLSTYAAVAKSHENLAAAEKLLGHPLPGTVSTQTGANAGILEIVGRAGDPEGAAVTARSAAQAFVTSLNGNGLLIPTIVNPAVAADTPLQPRPPLILSVAALLGAIAGVLLSLVLERLRRTIDTGDELTELTSLPMIGRLPKERALGRAAAPGLIWKSPNLDMLQESYRALRTNVELLRDARWHVLQVTSAEPGEGKSTVVANLAVAMGQIGVSVVVVDADLRRPRQHELFGRSNDIGLSTAMTVSDFDVSPQATEYPNVYLLPSGPVSASAAELLHVRLDRVLDKLENEYDVVLIDSPPVLPVSDARVIAPSADAILFVVGSERSRTQAIASAVEKLRFTKANIMGAVLNLAKRDDGEHVAYGYEPYTQPQPEPHPSRSGLPTG
jgi:capsular exopolysaccharide synthesis family protein